MNPEEIIHRLAAERVELFVAGGKLKVRGGRLALANPELLNLLRANRQKVLELVESGRAPAPGSGRSRAPANRIPIEAEQITPEMLPLIRLSREEIARVVASVQGGARNVKDIYPLAPLQQGILFHHLMDVNCDPYLGSHLVAFATRADLDSYVRALGAVINRHDILRSAVVWEGISQPVQVVLRDATLEVVEVVVDGDGGDAAAALLNTYGARQQRLDLKRAPLIKLYVAYDSPRQRWLMLELMHHLIGDHTTLEVMAQEIDAFVAGTQASLPEPLPFRNLVAQALFGVERAEHEHFFRELLQNFSEPTQAFGLRPNERTYVVRDCQRELDDSLGRRLARQARRSGVGAAALFHLAWGQVLARASGQDDVVFGTVMFGRMNGGAGADRTLGMFINTLPVRLRVDARPVQLALRQMHELLTQLLRYEHAPLEIVQRTSAVKAPAALFSALLNYRYVNEADGAAAADARSSPSRGQFLQAEERTTYPLVLNVNACAKDRFSISVQTESSVDPGRVASFVVAGVEALVEALEAQPDAGLASIDVLPTEERRRLLFGFNADQAAPYSTENIRSLFERQVERDREGAAAELDGEVLSYGALNARANRLARHLRALGVGRDDRVAVCVERSLDLVVALLGVVKSGAAYVPMDPTHLPSRLRDVLVDAAPGVVLVDARTSLFFYENLRTVAPNAHLVDVSVGADHWQAELAENPEWPAPSARDLAYVLYTSGSTGKPKGVMIEHAGLANLLLSMDAELQLSPSERVLGLTTVAFDISGLELFLPLVSGARIVIADRETGRDPFRLAELIASRGVTLVQATPSSWRALIASGWTGAPMLRKALSGGEALTAELAEQLTARVEHVWNVYGPTETTIWSTYALLPTKIPEGMQSIGRPIANTRLYILDAQRRPTPIGVSGELCIAGVGVARGYLNRAELTQNRFVDDPFVTDGSRMYRSGDLASFNEDGSVRFLGRNDGQVKLRGFRIELGEIEIKLTEHQAVQHAAVALIAATDREPYLAAYCVPVRVDGQLRPFPVEEIREFLAGALPDFMVPSEFVVLSALPLTPNGKLDRQSLPIPRSAPRVVRERPEGELEQRIARVWCEVLAIEQVGRSESFFDLGGTSISTVKVISRLRAQGIAVELADLFTSPTVAALAKRLAGELDAPAKPACIVVREGRGPGLFLVYEYFGLDWYFAPLAAHVSTTASIYGLQSVPLGERQLATIPELVARLLAAIKAKQSEGPYRLCGWSFGGNLAYEVARQLRADGERVDFLGLIDSSVAGVRDGRLKFDEGSALAELYRGEDAQPLEVLSVLNSIDNPSFDELVRALQAAGARRPASLRGLNQRDVRFFCERIVAHHRAWTAHVVEPIDVPVHLFTARERPPRRGTGEAGSVIEHEVDWARLLDGEQLKVVSVPGDHFTLMNPHNIAELGRCLTAALSRAEGRESHVG